MKLLLVEDDVEAAGYLRSGLALAGFETDHVVDPHCGMAAAESRPYAAMILDRNLPGMDGITALKSMRERGIQIPVLILSALGQIEDKVQGLAAGADDYLAKPFSIDELLARVKAMTRRQALETAAQTVLRARNLELNRLDRRARRGCRDITLLKKEYQLLEHLMLNAGQVVTRTQLIEAVWGLSFDPGTNVIEVHMSRLRSKVDQKGETPMISTLRGVGYRIEG